MRAVGGDEIAWEPLEAVASWRRAVGPHVGAPVDDGAEDGAGDGVPVEGRVAAGLELDELADGVGLLVGVRLGAQIGGGVAGVDPGRDVGDPEVGEHGAELLQHVAHLEHVLLEVAGPGAVLGRLPQRVLDPHHLHLRVGEPRRADSAGEGGIDGRVVAGAPVEQILPSLRAVDEDDLGVHEAAGLGERGEDGPFLDAVGHADGDEADVARLVEVAEDVAVDDLVSLGEDGVLPERRADVAVVSVESAGLPVVGLWGDHVGERDLGVRQGGEGDADEEEQSFHRLACSIGQVQVFSGACRSLAGVGWKGFFETQGGTGGSADTTGAQRFVAAVFVVPLC